MGNHRPKALSATAATPPVTILIPGYIPGSPINYTFDGVVGNRQTYSVSPADYGDDVPVYSDPTYLAAWVDGWMAGRVHYAEHIHPTLRGA